jgi:hypothetical protein
MIRRAVLFGLVSCSIFSLAADAASADLPERVRHYRFLPQRSVLNESGGIYPRSTDFRVYGTFDFVTARPDSQIGLEDAKFDNVVAWASHPILAYVLPLNRVLNLEGLKGRQLPVLGPYDAYKFEGVNAEGSAVNLNASVIGPWFHLRGETTPPPGSADMFVYEIRATARQTPFADFNRSESVDGSDLSTWLSGFGSTPLTGDSALVGDANDDHIVDGADFLTWQRQLGETPPADAAFDAVISAALASEAVAVASVPEPGSFVVLAMGAALVIGWRRRSLRSHPALRNAR